MDSRAKRDDVQVLRAIAVLLVVGFHADSDLVPTGYLGVDIFFVISGFLITRMIVTELERGTFTFRGFWIARARRILPAAMVTILLTIAGSWFVLSGQLLTALGWQALSAITFSANFYLATEPGGYFARKVEFEPLLHFWSLAVEEQYYLFAPLVLFITPRRFRVGLLLCVVVASLSLYVRPRFGLTNSQIFFYPLARAWELGLGGLVALSPRSAAWVSSRCGRMSVPLLIILIAVPFVPFESGLGARPIVQAVMLCASTALLLAIGRQTRGTSLPMRLLTRVGDGSYALYLVHWPALSLYRSARLQTELPWLETAGVLGVAGLGAIALHRWIEKPLHCGRVSTMILLPVLAVATVTAAVAGIAAIRLGRIETSHPSAVHGDYLGLGQACDFDDRFGDLPGCRNAPNPEFLVWGDSMGMALVPGLIADDASLIQATKALCGPLLGVAPVGKRTFDPAWARRCIGFNRSVADRLPSLTSVRTVILVSAFGQYLDDNKYQVLLADGHFERPNRRAALKALRETIAVVRATGKRVVIVEALPHAQYDVGLCAERIAVGRLVLGHAGCTIDAEDPVSGDRLVRSFLTTNEVGSAVSVISLRPWLCRSTVCRNSLDGIQLYHDSGHFTREGSIYLARRISLVRRIRSAAR